jgi:predicted RNA binding protein YcfA (HicA-like mRNA interferase family)
MKYCSNKDTNKLILNLLKRGWGFVKSKKHLKLKTPNGKIVVVSRTPSDRRAYQNFLSDIGRINEKEAL